MRVYKHRSMLWASLRSDVLDMKDNTRTKSSYQLPFSPQPWSYDEAIAHVRHINKLGISPLLEVVVDMLDELERPDAHFQCIQIAGTNGKTSTSRFCANILRAHGTRVALYTSPELVDIRDRLEIEGERVSRELFALGIAAAKEAGERVNKRRLMHGQDAYDVTEFDTITVASLVACALAEVEVCVLEVGLGGRWDATSATHPCLTCVTGIALDHTRILGDTVEAIAPEKAAIIKRGQAGCVLGPKALTPTSVRDVFLTRCVKEQVSAYPVCAKGDAKSCELTGGATYEVVQAPSEHEQLLHVQIAFQGETYDLRLAFPAYQAPNMTMAWVLSALYLQDAFLPKQAVQGIKASVIPGRFQAISQSPLHIIDAAHNVESLTVTLQEVKRRWPNAADRPLLLTAIFQDKQVEEMAAMLAETFPNIVVTQTKHPRALAADRLEALFKERSANVIHTYPKIEDALLALHARDYIALGTITLAGSALAYQEGLPIPKSL